MMGMVVVMIVTGQRPRYVVFGAFYFFCGSFCVIWMINEQKGGGACLLFLVSEKMATNPDEKRKREPTEHTGQGS